MTVDGRGRSRGGRPDGRANRSARSRPTARERAGSADRTPDSGRDHRGSADRERARSLRRKVFLIAAAGMTVVGALVGTLWFSPLMSVRQIEYTTDGVVTAEEALQALGIEEGTPLLRVDAGAAARRVAGIARVAEARVQREYPSTVRLTVTERIPVVFFDSPDGARLMDGSGVAYATEPPPFGVPRLVTPTPGRDDRPTQAALTVLDAVPDTIRFMVAEVAAPTISSVSVTLVDGRVVVWGSVDDSERKSAVLRVLMTQPGQVFDVSSPELPTVK